MKNLKFVYRESCGFDVSELTSKQHVFVIIHSDSQVRIRLGDETREEYAKSGDVVFCPSSVPHFVKWQGKAHYSMIFIERNCFDNPIFQTLDPGKVKMLPHFAQADPLIYGIGHVLRQSQRKKVSQPYLDSIVALLAAHILEWKCSQKFEQMEKDGALSYTDLQQVIDYIDARLSDKIVRDLP